MKELVGYKLVDTASSDVIEQWGGASGQCPGIPNPVSLPSGLVHIAAPGLDETFEDIDGKTYKLVCWEMEPAAPKLANLEPWRFFAALELSGFKTPLYNYFATLDPPMNVIARNRFEHVASFSRDDELVKSAQASLSIDDATLDQLWQTALSFPAI